MRPESEERASRSSAWGDDATFAGTKWERGHRSKNVEDARGDAPPRRGRTAVAIGGGGAVVVLVLAILSQVTGVNLMGLGGGGPASHPSQPSSQPPAPLPRPDPDAELFELSLRMELQADGYAGIWAHSTKQRELLEACDTFSARSLAI